MGKWIGRGLLGLIGVVVVLAAVLLARTYLFPPKAGVAPEWTAGLAQTPAPDGAATAQALAKAITFKTISSADGDYDKAAFEAFHAFLKAQFPRVFATFKVEQPVGHSLLLTWPGSDASLPPILLLAHQDVVPVEGASEAKWTHPAFDGVIANDKIYGRGALDDKASLIAILAAADQLIAAGAKPNRTVMLAFGHDEEVLGSGAAAMAKLIQSRGIKPWFALDEGMAIVADFPLTGKPAALIGVAEKGYLTVMVKAVDKGGHSSMPPKETAAVKVAKALIAIQDGGFPGGLSNGPARGMIEGLSTSAPFPANVAMANLWLTQPLIESQFAATPAGAAMLHTTIAPTMLRGGVKDNVLPQEAFAVVNFRLHPRDSQERVIARLKALTVGIEGVSIIQSTKGAEPSPVSSTQSSAYGLIAAAAKVQGPAGMPVLPGLVLGGTDARHYAGVATDVYRFFPAMLTQADIATIHGTDEQISVANLVRMQAFYAQLMLGG